MATKKTSEKEEKKTAKTSKAKKTEEAQTEKPVAKKVAKETPSVANDSRLDELQNEFEKLKAELSIIKQFKNNSDKTSSDKVLSELDRLKEIIYGLEDRIEELEYQVSEKDDY